MEERQIMSAEICEIVTALHAFLQEFKQPELNKSNPYFKSRYVDLSGCFKAAQPILAKNGLAVTQIVNGSVLVTMLMHTSGQWLRSYYELKTDNADEQKRGSAITYAKRYSYCAMLGIAADTDDDANAACGRSVQQQSRQYTQQQLDDALGQLACCNSEEEVRKIWNEWNAKCKPLCANNSEFYKAVKKRSEEFRK